MMERFYPHTPQEIAVAFPRLLSKRLFAEWAALFDDAAIVARVEDGAPTTIKTIVAALPEQIEYGNENRSFAETWHDVSIFVSGNIATITAKYTLDADRETRRGVDVLSLVKDSRGWRIVCLVYEQHALEPKL